MTGPPPLHAQGTRGRSRSGGSGPADLVAEVLQGLRATPKGLPPKLFYDAEGARLFERICEQPEYYLTRAELEILRARAAEVAVRMGPGCALLEYGSGAGIKVRMLLDALHEPAAYVPIDIAREQLDRVARAIAASYPGLDVRPLHADYTRPLALPPLPRGARRLAFFPGSTIGNFAPDEAAAFLSGVRRSVGREGALLLGVDRRKPVSVLDAAYNDAAGLTAAFNLNLLARLNRELDADFDLTAFRHVAFFDERHGRVEMHLESLADQEVTVAAARIRFARGETIWTESSYKYDRAGLERLAAAAGFALERLWTDAGERFWMAFLGAEAR